MDFSPQQFRPLHQERKSEPSFALVLMVVIFLLTIAYFAYFYFTRPAVMPAIPSNVMMRLDQKTVDLVMRANETPCNLDVSNMLATRLVGKSEYKAAVSFLDYVHSQCKLDENLTAIKILALKGLSDFKAAEALTNQILEEHPSSIKAYQWRYEARKGMGNLQGAYEDLKKVLDLLPNPAQAASWIYYDLAHLAAKLDKPCEAVNLIRDYVAYDHVARQTPQMQNLISQWQEKGNCQPPFGKGSARFVFDRAAPVVVLPVIVNGVKTRMVIDTGASRTLLTKELAEKAGIKPSYGSGGMVATVDNVSWIRGGRAIENSMGDAKSQNVPVFIQTTDKHTFGKNIGGLLGLSFLGNFEFSMSKGVLQLKPLE